MKNYLDSSALKVITTIMALFWLSLLFSCSSYEIVTSEHGRVIHTDDYTVTAEFDTYRKKKKKGIYKYVLTDKKAVNAFYLPSGHEFKIGDVYGK